MKILKLNIISWIQILSAVVTNAVFLISNIRHEYYLDFIINIVISSIIVLFGVIFSEKTSKLFSLGKTRIKTFESFKINFYAMSAVVVVFVFMYVGFEITIFHNSDVSGWMPLVIVAMTLVGFIFSLLFASIASFFQPHKIYTPAIILIIFLFYFMVFFQASMALGFKL